jgi:putative ABC transport system substrate-binding protein
VVFERREARDRPDLLPAAAAELARLNVDVILARGAQAVRAAMQATRTIPIVAMDLDGDALAPALAAGRPPADNVTGVALDVADLSVRQLELLRELLPSLAAVTIVGDPEVHIAHFQAMQRAGGGRSVTVRDLEIRSAQEFGDAFAMPPGRAGGALVVLSSPRLFAFRRDAAEIARQRGMPALFLYPAYADAGGLAAYGPDLPEVFRRCGEYVAQILAGARPAELPLARPERFRLVVNERTARALGVTIPESVRRRADQVIE